MLTVEVKVNGVIINHFYVVNQQHINEISGHEYTYTVYFANNRIIKNGKVTHRQSDGALTLVKKIIEDMEKGQK